MYKPFEQGVKMPEDCRAVTIVYTTRDYKFFKKLKGNRDIYKTRVTKIMASFEKNEILNPIIVNEFFEIIDGQGRFEALRILGRPIKFIIVPGAGINDCRLLNQFNSNWMNTDHIKSYAEDGNENYKELQKCAELTGFTYRELEYILPDKKAKLTLGGKIDGTLASGELIFTPEDTAEALNVKKHVDEIEDALQPEKRPGRNFKRVVATVIHADGYDHKRMLVNCTKCRSTFREMTGYRNMLIEFSRIYNFGSHGKRIYFEDALRGKKEAGGYRVPKTRKDIGTLGT